MHQGLNFGVRNALKLTYEHLAVNKIFPGATPPGPPGEGGRGWERRGGEGGGEGGEGRGKLVPPTFWTKVTPLQSYFIRHHLFVITASLLQ